MNCQVCGWEIKEGDVFCSWCRKSLLGFKINPSEERIYWDPKKSLETLEIEIQNSGCGSISNIKLSSTKDWLYLKEDILPIESLAPGIRRKISFLINPSFLPSGIQRESITFSSGNAGSLEFYLNLLPYPEISILIKDIEFDVLTLYKKEGDKIKEIEGKITLLNQTQVELEKIYSECDFIKKIEYLDTKVLSFDQKTIPIRIFVDISSLTTKEEHHTSFHIKLKDINEDFIYVFYTRCVMPPIVQILKKNQLLTDVYRLKCIETIPEKIEDLKIRNAGELSLIIEKIETTEDLILFCNPNELPYEVKQGEEVHLKIIIRSDQKPAGNYKGFLKIFSNSEPSEFCIDFLVEVTEIAPYKDFIAIDFGTTHSCACYYNFKTEEFEKIPLKDFDPKAILPSAIQYLEILHNEAKKIEVGETARANSFDPQLQMSTVTSIKRKLGSANQIKVIATENREEGVWLPEEVISHILNYMFIKIESHIRCKLDRVIITHPSKFRHSQVEALLRSFEKAGIKKEKIQKIQEPIAAAIDFIVNNPRKEEYDIMNFDFGGGTVDITLIHVNDKVEKGKRKIMIYTKARDGDSNFGGDDITEELKEILRLKAQLNAQRNGGGVFPTKPDPEKITHEDDIKVISNRLELIKKAEKIKIELSDVEEVRDSFYLYFYKEGKFESKIVNLDVTRNEFNKRIKSYIEGLIDRMKKIIRIIPDTNLKILLLSGKSSQIPLVKELMIKNFGEEIVHFPTELKECVSIGAVKYIQIKTTGGKVKIDIKEEECTVSNYGYTSQDIYGRSFFQTVIQEGTLLPTEEIKLEERGLERKAPRQFKIVEGPRTAKIKDLKFIATYYLDAPEDASDRELESAEFYMKMENDQNIKLISKIGEKKLEFLATIDEVS